MSTVLAPAVAFNDRTVTARYFGTGNASRLVWNLAGMDSDRALLRPAIYVGGSLKALTTDYAIDANGKVTFVVAPGSGVDVAYKDPWFGTANYKSFGTGDGTATQFSLPWKPVTEQIYKSDWAGNQLMYSSSRTNLILQSQTFQTTWSTSQSSVTPNDAVSPDGTTTADKFIRTATNASESILRQNTTQAVSTNYTLSVYALKGNVNFLRLRAVSIDGATLAQQSAFFNLNTGAVGTKGSALTSSGMVAVGGGWYRCWITYANGSVITNNIIDIAQDDADDGGVGGTSGDYIYIWGAQLESGTTATSYIPTTTAAASSTDYSITPGGTVTFATAPVSGAVLTWTGSMGEQR